MAVGFAATGGVLMHKQDMPAWLVSRALWLHATLAVAAIALFAGHLAHVLITKHGRTYLRGMVDGSIPEDLARGRHLRWWQAETGWTASEATSPAPEPPAFAAETGAAAEPGAAAEEPGDAGSV